MKLFCRCRCSNSNYPDFLTVKYVNDKFNSYLSYLKEVPEIERLIAIAKKHDEVEIYYYFGASSSDSNERIWDVTFEVMQKEKGLGTYFSLRDFKEKYLMPLLLEKENK